MSSFNRRVDKLVADIAAKSGVPVTAQDLADWSKRAADLVMQALRDGEHPLAAQFDDLRSLIMTNDLASEALYSPRPGSANPAWARSWPLQLLLLMAASYADTAQLLATRLNVPTEMIEQRARTARAYVRGWSSGLFARHLQQAVTQLRGPEKALPFTLDGQEFKSEEGIEVHLSRHEAALLQTLMAHVADPVTHEQLQEAGVTNPVHRLNALQKKLTDDGVKPLPIDSAPGSYTLRPDRG